MPPFLNRRDVLAALALLLVVPGAGFAQAPPVFRMLDGPAAAVLTGGAVEGLQPSELGVSLRQSLSPQAQERKSSHVAAGLEIIVPILGHGYAGNAKRGILPAILRVGGAVALAAAGDDEDKETQAAIGGLAFLGGSIWGIVSAVRTANEHNRSLSSGNASLTLLPTPDGRLGVGVALRY